MASQSDLFGCEPSQGELFGGLNTPQQVAPVTPDSVREKMVAILVQLRSAERMPWPERKVRINEVIFPQMANWLPREEGEQLVLEFEAEVQRLREAA